MPTTTNGSPVSAPQPMTPAPPMQLTMERPASRGDRVRDALERAILDGTFAPGMALVERDVADRLGVSKTPVREAFKQLLSSGLVVNNAYQGVSVRRLDAETVRHLQQARLSVEPQAVRLGVELHGVAAQPAARRALLEARSFLDGDNAAELGLANRRFHRELYILCGNEWLIGFLDQLQLLNTFVATTGWQIDPKYGAEADEHERILEAVESGDAARAEELVWAHISESAETLLRALDASGQGA